MATLDDQKFCGKCRLSKPLEAFNRHRAKWDGRQTHCRECEKTSKKIWRGNNKPRTAKYQRDYRAAGRLSPAVLEAYRVRARIYYHEHKDPYILRARQRDQIFAATPVDRNEVIRRFTCKRGIRCNLCYRYVEPDDIHLDHIIPLSRGGLHRLDNLAVTHSYCNGRKANKLLPAGAFS